LSRKKVALYHNSIIFLGMKAYDTAIPKWNIDRKKLKICAMLAGYDSISHLARVMEMSRQNLALVMKSGNYTRTTLSRLCHFCNCEPQDLLVK
jgi:DNA-binding Xre family transcriptional regulator